MNIKDKITIYVRVISPFDTFFEGQAYSVSAVDKTGPLDILPGHANLVALLTNGDIKINTPSGDHSFGINHGIIHVLNNRVDIMANV